MENSTIEKKFKKNEVSIISIRNYMGYKRVKINWKDYTKIMNVVSFFDWMANNKIDLILKSNA